MPVAGLLVHAHPERAREAREALAAIAGAEVHAGGAEGRFLVTVCLEGDEPMAEALTRIPLACGVLSAALVYSRQDDLDEDPATPQETGP